MTRRRLATSLFVVTTVGATMAMPGIARADVPILNEPHSIAAADVAATEDVVLDAQGCIPSDDLTYRDFRVKIQKLSPSPDAPVEALEALSCRPDRFGAQISVTAEQAGAPEPVETAAKGDSTTSGTLATAKPKKCWTRNGPRSIEITMSSLGVRVASFTTSAWGCMNGLDVSSADYYCSGSVTSYGQLLGVAYDGALDDYGTYYSYGKRAHGGYHAFCKGKFEFGPLSRSSYVAGSVWLHADYSTETKTHKV